MLESISGLLGIVRLEKKNVDDIKLPATAMGKTPISKCFDASCSLQ